MNTKHEWMSMYELSFSYIKVGRDGIYL
jgi:hypothetical protein